jgi:hypothetical protein
LAFANAERQLHERVRQEWTKVNERLLNVALDAEWKYFTDQEGRIVDPSTPLRDPEFIDFPFHDHDATKPVREGYLRTSFLPTQPKKGFFCIYSKAARNFWYYL